MGLSPFIFLSVTVHSAVDVAKHIANWMESTLERVQLPAEAKFGVFVTNTWQHLPHLLLEV